MAQGCKTLPMRKLMFIGRKLPHNSKKKFLITKGEMRLKCTTMHNWEVNVEINNWVLDVGHFKVCDIKY